MERGSTILTAIIAGAISGALGALTVGWAKPREMKPAPAIRVAAADELPELRADVAALREEVARLEKRQRTPSAAPAAPAAATAPAGTTRALADDPVFETAVRDVMERLQQDQADERDGRRAQRWGFIAPCRARCGTALAVTVDPG